MALSVIGVGFGRTGTMSLKLALEQLGLGRCHHMMELFQGEAGEVLTKKWEAVAYGGAADWDDVFAGFASTVDWPSTAYWRELAERYPDAKVILTLRDADHWFESTQSTIFRESVTGNLAERTDPWARMVQKIIGQDTFGGGLNDREHCIAVYRRHNEEVQRTIPPERLLVYETSRGWEPLCRFLDVPVPESPFPKANTTEQFQARIAAAEDKKPATG